MVKGIGIYVMLFPSFDLVASPPQKYALRGSSRHWNLALWGRGMKRPGAAAAQYVMLSWEIELKITMSWWLRILRAAVKLSNNGNNFLCKA